MLHHNKKYKEENHLSNLIDAKKKPLKNSICSSNFNNKNIGNNNRGYDKCIMVSSPDKIACIC